jgi:hypothetical protein
LVKKYRREKMGKKYLDTKEGSLEQSVLGVWEEAALKQEKLVGGQKKLDKDKDGDIDGKDFAMLRKSKKKDKKEEVDLDEGKMKELHMLIKQGKSAEEIAKIMKVDVKTIKALMAGYMSSSYHETVEEALEWGTDELRKHTEDVTPGQDGEWVEAINAKNKTMREALAQVWNVDEGKSPFKKEDKKDGKTLTGKKVASVDINPTIKEKVK